jgi:hypothetical protein
MAFYRYLLSGQGNRFTGALPTGELRHGKNRDYAQRLHDGNYDKGARRGTSLF